MTIVKLNERVLIPSKADFEKTLCRDIYGSRDYVGAVHYLWRDEREEMTMSQASLIADHLASAMPRVVAELVNRINEDVSAQVMNNHAYRMPVDLVTAYIKDFVCRHAFQVVYFYHDALPAPGVPYKPILNKLDTSYVFSIGIHVNREKKTRELAATFVRSDGLLCYRTDVVCV